MALPQGELTCKQCGHSFNRLVSQKDNESRCPRCGSQDIDEVPYLLGTADPDVSAEDYFDVALAPCCTANWLGWRHHFYSTGAWASTHSQNSEKRPAEEVEPGKKASEGAK